MLAVPTTGGFSQEQDMNFRKLLCSGTILAGLTVLSLAVMARPALAGSTTASLDIGATVDAVCSMTSSPLNIGTYDATTDSDTTATGSISYSCSDGTTTASIALDKGTTTGGTISQRLMAGTGSNTDTLEYNIYQDSSHATLWGDGSTGTVETDNNASDTISYYVKVPDHQYVAADSYSDSVTATLTF